jgi:hypothetical protein
MPTSDSGCSDSPSVTADRIAVIAGTARSSVAIVLAS